jgi:hypothetical protein
MADHKLYEDNVGQTSNSLKAQVLEGLLMLSYDDSNMISSLRYIRIFEDQPKRTKVSPPKGILHTYHNV